MYYFYCVCDHLEKTLVIVYVFFMFLCIYLRPNPKSLNDLHPKFLIIIYIHISIYAYTLTFIFMKSLIYLFSNI